MSRPTQQSRLSALSRLLLLPALLLLIANQPTHCHRILGIFTHIGGSHFHTFYPIMNSLAERGHNVTVLSYFTAKQPSPNYNELRFDGIPIINSSVSLERNPGRSLWQMYEEYFVLHSLGEMMCLDTFKQPHFDTILAEHRREPFDLVVTEFFDSDCVLGFIHLLGVPYVGLSSCVLMPWLHDRVAQPDLPSVVPNEFVGFSERMSYTERVVSWLMTKSLKLMYRRTEWNDNRLIAERFGPGIPDVAELARNVSLVLVNTHFSLHGVRPMGAQLVEIGGVHIKEARPLPVGLKGMLDGAENGVILVSWGSNLRTSSLEGEKVEAILEALGKLKQLVVWKWEDEKLLEGRLPKNVYVSAWLPQREILCHPNVRLFWSHGGNLGTSESVHCGTPLIVTPIYGDQFVNEAAVINRRMALSLPFQQLDDSAQILRTLLAGLAPELKEAALRTSLAFRSRPLTSLRTATWWIEHVIETGGMPLGRSPASEMTWFAYHSVDAMLTLFGAAAVLMWLAWQLVRCCVVRTCCRSGARSEKKAGGKVGDAGKSKAAEKVKRK